MITADLRDVAQVRALVDAAVDATVRLDIMINNAGLSFPASILDGEPEEWRAMLENDTIRVTNVMPGAIAWAYGKLYQSSGGRRRALPAWLRYYNQQRPHRSLSMATPMTRLQEAR